MKLGVNIDHVATIREARKTFEPDPVHGAVLAELGGADQITVHLREDRRHIQDRDLKILRETVKTMLNLEMANSKEIAMIALQVKPRMATLVPERREEITTEGGLNVFGNRVALKETVSQLKNAGIFVSLFVDPDIDQIKASHQISADAVEIHTGEYANNFGGGAEEESLNKIISAARFAKKLGLVVNAGHGITYRNVKRIVKIEEIVELNIGHSIISRAVLVGMERAVREMKELVKRW